MPRRLLRSLRVNGARGVTMLGFGAISLLLGVAFAGGPLLGGFAVWPPPPVGLSVLVKYGGLHLWGAIWLLVGCWVTAGAFMQNQRRPLATFAAMCGMWGTAYGIAFVELLALGRPSGLWLSAALFYALTVGAAGVGRMVNAPALHVERIADRLRFLTEDYMHRHGRDAGAGDGNG
jgi:hypothetical protein